MSLPESVQSVVDSVVSSVDTYNTGLAHCDNLPTHSVYMTLFVFIFVGVFSSNTSAKSSVAWLRHAVESIVIAVFIVFVVHCFYTSTDTPSNIYVNPLASARYGCMYNSRPISLTPLFNDKKVLARVSTQFTKYWYDRVVIDTIALLKSLSIENYYVNNCTCVC